MTDTKAASTEEEPLVMTQETSQVPSQAIEDNNLDDNEDDEDDNEAPEELKSAYQVAREANIRRNLAELEAIGLDLGPATLPAESTEKEKPQATTKRIRAAPREGTRKSRRLADQPALAAAAESKRAKMPPRWRVATIDDEDDCETPAQRAKLATMERKLERLKELHLKEGSTYKNPTATYEHTWMRVRTMSDKALARRICVIESACGEHCIVKMRMFAEVLILAGKMDLAKDAEAALKRLTSLVTRA
ncbi:Hypothetical Protein FCC1311_094762 [Hondaea fermentalgiana]|uniref:Uncharacterized protein n=1 Tax=Hondaea fermentalgiana TaxID=2315210 RepID=A0A2R5GQU5_9STRA|nr:Hypothetical Protein FCC1311_094762 [Hondaea fermentalgiana]|eukprot:GBG33252.1 Hypothetical Protein FCC1311_094762 [Hondaea fermentalgiana]